ncbi:rod shape-determining protein [Jeotgalibaca caeni]|uniref:rod shape-determining protein n=1 Tax=Jeotgalibaca caeni TaxID=3028623 RepID=UPI00237DA8D5|nr:rod shape-determining protein [Jeotgalibaca caeni]MDE1548377.1 rod shape-determining protein [Jeotgalibaca caeni]
MAVFSLKAPKIAIDLGTANTIVYVEGKGIVVEEPSVIARNIYTGEILAVGNEAFQKIGNAPGSTVASRPLKDGVIADFESTVEMIKYFIKKAVQFSLKKPSILICAPSGITNVEKRAIIDASQQAGASHTFLIDEPYAAALGAGLPVLQPIGTMIIDIGGGTTDVATISLGNLVKSRSQKVGGDKMDEAILTYVKKNYSLLIGERTAEAVKKKLGSASPVLASRYGTFQVQGREEGTGIQRTVTLEATEVAEAIQENIQVIIQLVKEVLEETAPEIASDVITQGVVLTGGGALLRDIAEVFQEALQLPVRVAADPLHSVVLGTGDSLKNIDKWKKNYLQTMR